MPENDKYSPSWASGNMWLQMQISNGDTQDLKENTVDIYQEEPEFKPIHIVLKTKEESQAFWSIMDGLTGHGLHLKKDELWLIKKTLELLHDKIGR